jgi:hypothetical protein
MVMGVTGEFWNIDGLGLWVEAMNKRSIIRQLKQTAMNKCSVVNVFPSYSLPLALANGLENTTIDWL